MPEHRLVRRVGGPDGLLNGTGCCMWGMVARLEARVDGTGAEEAWREARASVRLPDGSPRTLRLNVLANALALVHFDADEDVADLRTLVEHVGRGDVATLQEELLAPIDVLPGRPTTTQLVRALGERAWGKPSRTDGSLTQRDDEMRRLCAASALRLLTIEPDDGPLADVPELTSEEQLLEVFHSGDVLLWRRLVSDALAEPWSGRADQHLALLDPERRPGEVEGIRALADLARRTAEEDERRAVADHIRTTIAATGLTQREFATLVGTSPSRLSTYVTGSVTPSAAMLLRINRTAKRARTGGDGPA